MFKFKLIDKERYFSELRDLTRCNKTIDKPKKPLTPYMLFVREVRFSFKYSPLKLNYYNRPVLKSSEIIQIYQHLIL